MKRAATVLLASLASVLAGCFRDPVGPQPPPTPKAVWFPTDVAGLEEAKAPEVLEPEDGDTVLLEAAPVRKVLKGVPVRMLAYNGSIPGPTIKVKRGSSLVLRVRNRTGLPSSLHSHGIRMDHRHDGVATSAATTIPDSGQVDYALNFPDAGLFWYHPHLRGDYAIELGQYGNFLVTSEDTGYWGPVNREQVIMVDDFHLDPDSLSARFRVDDVSHTMMGRFGNLYLVNGDTAFSMSVKRKERVRFFATNSANARVMNLEFRDPAGKVRKHKLVGSDNGPYEWFEIASATYISPSERRILDMHFDQPGRWTLVNHFPKTAFSASDSVRFLASITVLDDSVSTGYGDNFLDPLEGSSFAKRSMDSVRAKADTSVPPDKTLLLTGFMDMRAAKRAASRPDPISVADKEIEWFDDMEFMNRVSNLRNMRWFIRDLETGKENHAIDWTFKRGELVKIRIINDTAVAHRMPHPFHVHGQRFVIASIGGRPNRNMAWKDTYLVGGREVTDIVLDASNPGTWMAHCHIAEHHEAAMMFHFRVD